MFCPEPYSEVTEAKVQEHLAKHAPFGLGEMGLGTGAMLGKNDLALTCQRICSTWPIT
jgi:hypothetical protein